MSPLPLFVALSVAMALCSLGLASCEKACAVRTDGDVITVITAGCDR